MACHALSYYVYGNAWYTQFYQCNQKTEMSDRKISQKLKKVKMMRAHVVCLYGLERVALTRQQLQKLHVLGEQMGPVNYGNIEGR